MRRHRKSPPSDHERAYIQAMFIYTCASNSLYTLYIYILFIMQEEFLYAYNMI